MPEGSPVQALVVSGFLGSGKTTLVRHLLEDAQRQGIKLGIISNEFGELGIDAALLGDTGDAYVELEGGCVCCRLSDELIASLELLRERVRPDRVVVETSGVALPYDTQLHFWRAPVSDWIRENVAAVVVNAEQVLQGRDLEGTFEDQVGSADLILMSKLDLVPAERIPEIERYLDSLAPDAPRVPCPRGRVASEVFFPPEPRNLPPRPREASDHHHESFSASELEIEAGINEDVLRERLADLGALRVKGFVETDRGLRVIQGVGPRIEIDAPPPHALQDGGRSLPEPGRIVVIQRTPPSEG